MGWLILLVITIGVAWWGGSRRGGCDAKCEQFKKDRDAKSAEIAELRAIKQALEDSLRAHEAANAAVIAHDDSLADRLANERQAKDAVLARLKAIQYPDTGMLARAAREAIALAESYRAEADSMRTARDRTRAVWEQTKADLAAVLKHSDQQAVALDSCDALLQRAPLPHDEKFLGIKLPSRKASYVAGTGTGFVLATVVYLAAKSVLP